MHAKGMRSKHGKKMPKSSFIAMLNNSFYHGVMEYDGVMYPNKNERGEETYKPLIDKETFDVCQAVLAKNNNHANRERKHSAKFFLRAVLRCGVCGGRMTAEIHDKKNGASYYHCSLTKKKHSLVGQYIKTAVLEELIAREFRKIQFTHPLMERIVAKAKDILEETHSVVDTQRRQVQNKMQKLEARRSNLEDSLGDKVIDPADFKRKSAEIKAELGQLQGQLNELNEERDTDIEIFTRFMELTDDLYRTYTDAEPHLKKHLLSLFFETITLKDRKILKADYTGIITALFKNRAIIISDNWLPILDIS